MHISRGLAATTLLATLGMSLLTGSSVSAKENRASGHRTFTVIAHLSDPYIQQIDVGAPGTSAGDMLLIDRPLYDPKTGRQVGTSVAEGTFIRVFPDGDVLFAFNATNKLEGGELSTQGAFRFSEVESTFAIVGGTGAFARARGTVTLRTVDANTMQFTFNVLP
jgi:allene oxide cyclase